MKKTCLLKYLRQSGSNTEEKLRVNLSFFEVSLRENPSFDVRKVFMINGMVNQG